jgi:lipoyl(octanoyl) transferase
MHRLKSRPKLETSRTVAWAVSDAPVDYAAAVAFMEKRAAEVAAGVARELVWLVEHPPLYTAGTSAKPADLLQPDRFPVFKTGRGGQFTYHGPGQRVVYVMLDVKRRTGDVRSFVGLLEAWIIDALARVGVAGETRAERVGVWVRRPRKGANTEDKVAAIGIRVRKWVSFHGFAINVSPELEHFSGIVACGVRDYGVTSLSDLATEGIGQAAGMAELDAALEASFRALIGPLTHTTAPVLAAEQTV